MDSRQLFRDVTNILEEAKTEGRPTTSVEEFLGFMADRGLRSPDDAYYLKFRDELKELEQTKLKGLKKEGLTTQEGSEAGSKKTPQTSPPTKDNLEDKVKAHLASRKGKEV